MKYINIGKFTFNELKNKRFVREIDVYYTNAKLQKHLYISAILKH